MTDPNYVAAMKKSAAFVTDFGGILCHAAIVSRELGTPCVIGTDIATKVFRTGDMLEVDADNGVVRKINTFTRKLQDLHKGDSTIAGGKGANLGELTKLGFRVPPGFVVLASAFEKFLDVNDLRSKILKIGNSTFSRDNKKIAIVAKKIKRLIMGSKIPEEVMAEISMSFDEFGFSKFCVRSSGVSEDGKKASWAGQLKSFLNVPREKLEHRIKKCWASRYSKNAISYASDTTNHFEIELVAVVVQELVDSETSGVAFSAHPVTRNHNHVVIDAGVGLGEAIVSGHVTPDNYVVDKRNWNIVSDSINPQRVATVIDPKGGTTTRSLTDHEAKRQKLDNITAVKLAKTVNEIAAQYGYPCDVEWAEDATGIYIVQCRPITTMDTSVDAAVSYKDTYDSNIDWTHRLTRPVSIFGASLWYIWHQSQRASELIGARMTSALYVERQPNLMMRFRSDKQLRCSEQAFDDLVQYNPGKLYSSLEQAVELNDQAEKHLKRNGVDFPNFGSAIEFFVEHGLHATVLADGTLRSLERKDIQDHPCRNIAESLRLQSLYHLLITSSLYPLAIAQLEGDNIENASQAVELLTISELLIRDYSKLEDRLAQRKSDRLCIYQSLDCTEIISWVDDTEDLINRLTGVVPAEVEKEDITGTVSFNGHVSGRAAVILNDHGRDSTFNDGDIIVTIYSSPNMMPLVERAKGIVADEGGMASHAAIISRKLKTPGIVGTKAATRIIRDGDTIEVDAERGVVKVIRRKGEAVAGTS